jgi:hypothetical protein
MLSVMGDLIRLSTGLWIEHTSAAANSRYSPTAEQRIPRHRAAGDATSVSSDINASSPCTDEYAATIQWLRSDQVGWWGRQVQLRRLRQPGAGAGCTSRCTVGPQQARY